MKLAALRCRRCGRERLVLPRERGATLACDACGEPIEVPENLEFPKLAALYDDRALASRLDMILAISFCTSCLPLSAAIWWHVDGVMQRTRDEGRPVEPRLRFLRNVAIALTAIQVVAWIQLAVMYLR